MTLSVNVKTKLASPQTVQGVTSNERQEGSSEPRKRPNEGQRDMLSDNVNKKLDAKQGFQTVLLMTAVLATLTPNRRMRSKPTTLRRKLMIRTMAIATLELCSYQLR